MASRRRRLRHRTKRPTRNNRRGRGEWTKKRRRSGGQPQITGTQYRHHTNFANIDFDNVLRIMSDKGDLAYAN